MMDRMDRMIRTRKNTEDTDFYKLEEDGMEEVRI